MMPLKFNLILRLEESLLFYIRSLLVLFIIPLLTCNNLFAAGAPSASERTDKDKTFAAIQVIGNVVLNAEERTIEKYGSLAIDGFLKCDVMCETTICGLYLMYEPYWKSLLTPWGRVDIDVGMSQTDPYADFKMLRQHLKLKFVSNIGEWEANLRSSRKVNLYKEGDLSAPITLVELERLRGTDTFIRADLSGHPSLYKIESVKGRVLPRPIFAQQDTAGVPYSDYIERREDWKKRLENDRDFKKFAFKKLFKTGSLGIKPLDDGIRPGSRSKITRK